MPLLSEQLTLQPLSTSNSHLVPRLVQINHDAMYPDPLFRWMEMYTPQNEDDSTREALNAALKGDNGHRTVVAVLRSANNENVLGERDQGEATETSVDGEGMADDVVVVGFVHWFEGYLDVTALRGDKDPDGDVGVRKASESMGEEEGQEQHKEKQKQDQKENLSDEIEHIEIRSNGVLLPTGPGQSKCCSTEEAARKHRLARGEAMYADSRQHYIRTIRWRRHAFIRRLMVDPRYQRRGIAGKLIKHVTDHADARAIPCWLYSRPAGVPLYVKSGFETAGITQLGTKELDVPESRAMVRWPVSHWEEW